MFNFVCSLAKRGWLFPLLALVLLMRDVAHWGLKSLPRLPLRHHPRLTQPSRPMLASGKSTAHCFLLMQTTLALSSGMLGRVLSLRLRQRCVMAMQTSRLLRMRMVASRGRSSPSAIANGVVALHPRDFSPILLIRELVIPSSSSTAGFTCSTRPGLVKD